MLCAGDHLSFFFFFPLTARLEDWQIAQRVLASLALFHYFFSLFRESCGLIIVGSAVEKENERERLPVHFEQRSLMRCARACTWL